MKKAPEYLKNNEMYTDSDFEYFKSKGYSNKEIKAIWDREIKNGEAPIHHVPAPDIVGYLTGRKKEDI